MYSVSALVELAKTDLPASISWLNGNSTIKAVSGCAVTITIMVKAWSSIQKAILDWKAKKLASKISEQTHVASFSSTDIRDAITGYVWPDASAIDPADEADLRNVPVTGSLHDAVLKIIGAQRERLHLILLADSGMGKTTFCINFYAKYWKKRNVAIVPLGRADAVEQIHVIPSPQETILFLDAFDEDASAVRDKESRFTELMEAAKNFQHVIVTCRSQFFLHDEEIPKGSRVMRVGPRRAGEVREYLMRRLYLAPFSPAQIDRYLTSHFPHRSLTTFGARRRAREMVRSIPELTVRPMLLALIPDLVREGKVVRELFELYEYMVDKWLVRESDWIEQDLLLSISKDLAVRLYVQQQDGGLDRLTAQELANVSADHGNDTQGWKLTSRSLLNRDINGFYKFAHRSILEYLFVTAALDGQDRCFTIPWTDLMKELLISRNVATDGCDTRVAATFSRDLSATRLLPLVTHNAYPTVQSKTEILTTVLSRGLDMKAARIDKDWLMGCYRVVDDDEVITLTDLARGASWKFPTSIPAKDDPAIYLEPLSLVAHEVAEGLNLVERTALKTQLPRQPVKLGRLPSTLEMLWLSDYLEAHAKVQGQSFPGSWLLDDDRYFWLGDALKGTTYLVCTFNAGEPPYDLVRIAPALKGKGNSTGGFAVYEVAQRPGLPWNASFCAFSVRVPRGLADLARAGMLEIGSGTPPEMEEGWKSPDARS